MQTSKYEDTGSNTRGINIIILWQYTPKNGTSIKVRLETHHPDLRK